MTRRGGAPGGSRSNPTEAVTPVNKTLCFEYWPDGSVKRRQLADASWTGDYSYDAAGRLYSVDNASAANGQPGFFIDSITYTARGQTDLITYGNGARQLHL